MQGTERLCNGICIKPLCVTSPHVTGCLILSCHFSNFPRSNLPPLPFVSRVFPSCPPNPSLHFVPPAELSSIIFLAAFSVTWFTSFYLPLYVPSHCTPSFSTERFQWNTAAFINQISTVTDMHALREFHFVFGYTAVYTCGYTSFGQRQEEEDLRIPGSSHTT